MSVHKRVQTALVVESGDMREVMHAALLLGYGASAVCPYMAFAVIGQLVRQQRIQMDYSTAEKNYIKALCKGLLKVISKMGISTLRSYRGAKLFEAVGLGREFSDRYLGGTTSAIGGAGLKEIAEDVLKMHHKGFVDPHPEGDILPMEGFYSYRRDGEQHAWNPQTIATLQQATRSGDYARFKQYTALVDEKENPSLSAISSRSRKARPFRWMRSKTKLPSCGVSLPEP